MSQKKKIFFLYILSYFQLKLHIFGSLARIIFIDKYEYIDSWIFNLLKDEGMRKRKLFLEYDEYTFQITYSFKDFF